MEQKKHWPLEALRANPILHIMYSIMVLRHQSHAADDGDTGSIRINANAGVVIHTDIGVGMRGASDLKITPIVSAGF